MSHHGRRVDAASAFEKRFEEEARKERLSQMVTEFFERPQPAGIEHENESNDESRARELTRLQLAQKKEWFGLQEIPLGGEHVVEIEDIESSQLSPTDKSPLHLLKDINKMELSSSTSSAGEH